MSFIATNDHSKHVTFAILDMDRALKHGLGGIVQADPFDFNQAEMFATLQRLTLLHRLNDSYTCLVSDSINN